jgi:hypothetical protein
MKSAFKSLQFLCQYESNKLKLEIFSAIPTRSHQSPFASSPSIPPQIREDIWQALGASLKQARLYVKKTGFLLKKV